MPPGGTEDRSSRQEHLVGGWALGYVLHACSRGTLGEAIALYSST